MVNYTLYEGALEKVCVRKGLPIVSHTDRQPQFLTASRLIKNGLMDLWKQRQPPFNERIPKYKAEIDQDNLPNPAQLPELKICSLVDGALVLPRDIRAEFLTDTVRSPEWRKIIQEFDRCYGRSAADAAEVVQPAGNDDAAPGPGNAPLALEPAEEAAGFHSRCDAKTKGKFNWSPELTAYLVEQNPSDDSDVMPEYEFYLEASVDYTIGTDEPVLTYGAGSWLTDSKVDTFLANAPSNHRGVLCKFDSDLLPVVVEAGGLLGRINCFSIFSVIVFSSPCRKVAKIAISRRCGQPSNIVSRRGWWTLSWVAMSTVGHLLSFKATVQTSAALND